MKTRLLTAVLLLAAWTAVAGEATFIVKAAVLPRSRAVNGHVQDVRVLGPGRAEVHVSTTLDPIGARGFAVGQPRPIAGTPGWFRLPQSLGEMVAGENDPWGRATRILRWVMDHVRINAQERGAQDAGSVLERGSGRCSGLANAATALLRAAGFTARTVSGLLVLDSCAIPHRWVECFLPGAGWVPTDPTLGLWIVTPRHVAWPGTVTGAYDLRATRVPADDMAGVSRAWGWPVRWNRGAVLECRVVGSPGTGVVLAELRGPDGELRRLRLDGAGQFDGLPPGRWLLTVRLGNEVVEKCAFRLEEGGTVSYAIRLPGPELG